MTATINSKMFTNARYDMDTETLFLTFTNNGQTYAYHGVSVETANEFWTADSAGTYFRHNIRDCHYTEKVAG